HRQAAQQMTLLGEVNHLFGEPRTMQHKPLSKDLPLFAVVLDAIDDGVIEAGISLPQLQLKLRDDLASSLHHFLRGFEVS
ncbi:MAG TPA: hypothetical protein VM223_12040, partial [Planctomycetota bacterium]|nr:hypothetical protein [Planctomycetota bacterium]